MKIFGQLAAVAFGLWTMASVCSAETLRVLCWEGYADKSYVDGFVKHAKDHLKKDVQITVKHVSSPNEWFDAVREGSFELLGGVAHNLPRSHRWKMIENKLLAEVDLANVPNYKNLIQGLQKASYITENGKVYGVAYTYGPYGLAYNTDLVKDEPKSWNVFFDPKYSGKYALSSDYYEANIYLTAQAIGLNREQIFNYDKVRSPELTGKLKALARGAKNYWVGVDTAKDLKGLALATSWGFALPELKKLGENWKMAEPAEGTTGWVDNWVMPASITKNPGLKRLAEEWINYMLSDSVQAGIVRNIGSYPVTTTVAKVLSADERARFKLDDPDNFSKSFILWEPLDARTTNGFKALWEEAKGSSK